jgi:hypothetical protein
LLEQAFEVDSVLCAQYEWHSSTSAALAAALLASSAAVVLSLVPPRVLPGVLAVRLRGGGTDEGCELLPSTRPGRAKGSASFADFEHRLPIAVGQGIYLIKFRYRPKSGERIFEVGALESVVQRLN